MLCASRLSCSLRLSLFTLARTCATTASSTKVSRTLLLFWREGTLGFVLRRYPDHSLLRFCDEVNPALVAGDENPMREPESWRREAAKKLKVPLWTVDADVIVPSKLLGKTHYAAHTMRPRLTAMLKQWLVESRNPDAIVGWKMPNGMSALNPGPIERWPNMERILGPFCTASVSWKMQKRTTSYGTPHKCKW